MLSGGRGGQLPLPLPLPAEAKNCAKFIRGAGWVYTGTAQYDHLIVENAETDAFAFAFSLRPRYPVSLPGEARAGSRGAAASPVGRGEVVASDVLRAGRSPMKGVKFPIQHVWDEQQLITDG